MVWFLMSTAFAEAPAAAASPRFVSTIHRQGLILTPGDEEWVRIHKGTAVRPVGIEVGRHPVAAMPIRLSRIDGVSVGSQWWVGAQGQHCTVDGFQIVEMDAATHRPASPCGEPLILATLDCSEPLTETRPPSLALPLQETTPDIGEALPSVVLDESSPHHAVLQADPTHATLTTEQMLTPPSLTRWRLESGEVQVIQEGSLSRSLSSVLVDRVVRSVHEGSITTVLDLDQDGSPELLGWGGQVPGVGEDLYSWRLWSADGDVLMSAVIDWCEGG